LRAYGRTLQARVLDRQSRKIDCRHGFLKRGDFTGMTRRDCALARTGAVGVQKCPALGKSSAPVHTTSGMTVSAYKGSGPAIVDLLGGQTRLIFANIVAVLMLGSVMREREMLDRIAAQGTESAPSRPDEFGKLIAAEVGTWAKVIKAASL
jgi:tripartite-type tricarboxylate transporter receptor subunit TctC